jgi:hypothetical protein
MRHDDGCRHTQQLRGKRYRLRVVTGREGRDTRSPLLGIELRQRVEGPAEFEGPAALEVLAFEENLGTQLLVRGTRGQDRCPVRMALEPLGGGDYIGIGRHTAIMP